MMTWDELEKTCLECKRCALYETRTNVVFGAGNPNSDVLFVGEGPGEQEDKQGKPFVGRAGVLLDDMLKIINLDREKNIYIANIVKCRPPKNRDPLNTEQDACIEYLRKQYQLMNPKIIVCLGRIAAMKLIDQNFKITRDHGKWFFKEGTRFMALYHPAALLRDPHKRPDTFVDLKELERTIKEVCPETYLLP